MISGAADDEAIGLRSAPQKLCEAEITQVDYPAAISRVARIGSLSTLQSALKFASRGLTWSVSQK